MQRGKLFWATAGIAIALILGYLVGKRGSLESSDQPTAPVVRSYQVPVERASEIRNALNTLFWKGKDDNSLGHAQLFNGGLLLVRAPEEIQAGVGGLIRQITEQKLPSNRPIHIDYWLVTGEEAKTSNGEGFRSLGPVLSSITKVDGPRSFRVLEHLASNSLSGQKVMLKGSIVDSKMTANLVGSYLTLDTRFQSPFGDVESSTRLESGDYVILGENSVKPEDVRLHDEERFKGARDERQINVYHILHAEILK